ncbi:hypothetical protein [Prevotella sp.]|uniref:hypothetical protein n=1 Tax=Prevotella sp. TaxID=59823 RepID=UPI002F92D850
MEIFKPTLGVIDQLLGFCCAQVTRAQENNTDAIKSFFIRNSFIKISTKLGIFNHIIKKKTQFYHKAATLSHQSSDQLICQLLITKKPSSPLPHPAGENLKINRQNNLPYPFTASKPSYHPAKTTFLPIQMTTPITSKAHFAPFKTWLMALQNSLFGPSKHLFISSKNHKLLINNNLQTPSEFEYFRPKAKHFQIPQVFFAFCKTN